MRSVLTNWFHLIWIGEWSELSSLSGCQLKRSAASELTMVMSGALRPHPCWNRAALVGLHYRSLIETKQVYFVKVSKSKFHNGGRKCVARS